MELLMRISTLGSDGQRKYSLGVPREQHCRRTAVSGYLSSAQKIQPIVLPPVVVAEIDGFGYRIHITMLAPLFRVIARALLGFSSVHPSIALASSDLSGVINALPLRICIPILLRDQNKIGAAC
ncbi:hypothetical protein FKW77_005001 [Venturia effusa]|uniref:Uncharacterized protein n=1 Tax=Venturia effusa TaxID=50376 RepID=A0A517LDN1_9PEZI|nr:hypothetical protein FKW77_005001 [Venturia effusa]